MKKKFILFPLLAGLLFIILTGYQEGPASFGGQSATEATGDGGCSCHNPSSTNTVTLELLSAGVPVTSYVGGNSYTIRISSTQNDAFATLPRFGFQLAVVKAAGAGSGSAVNAGTMSGAVAGTTLFTLGGIKYFEHSGSSIAATTGTGDVGTTYVRTITWTAPAATGDVVVYGSLNEVNNDHGSGGDEWANSNITFTELKPITGTLTVCAGSTTTLSDLTAGGTWNSGSTGIATVDAAGVVSGVAGGTSVISYTQGGVMVTKTVTVNALPTVVTAAGGGAFCNSTTITASNGGSGTIYFQGTTSGGTSTATASSSQVVSSTGIYYFRALSAAGCWGPQGSVAVTINPTPAAIGGSLTVCPGITTTLTDATGAGTWLSGNTAAATIGSGNGVVTGVAGGTSIITYTVTATGCSTTSIVTVNAAPTTVVAAGGGAFCGSTTITASNGGSGTIYFQGTTSGGTSTATASSSQVVSSSGIYYFRAQSALGCWGTEGSVSVTINPVPAAIGGTLTVCPGLTTTLTDATGTGTWLSGNTAAATIGTSNGVVTGVAGGTSVITYTVTATGCSTTSVVTVNAAPTTVVAAGGGAFCGSTTITASNGGSGTIYFQGTTSGGTSTATASASQVVSSSGIYYFRAQSALGCWSTEGSVSVTINPVPAAIGGTLVVCPGLTTTLTDATGSGTWLSGNTAAATIGSGNGVVTGVAGGTSVITYTVTATGCSTTSIVTVNAAPATVVAAGSGTFCTSTTITASNGGSGTIYFQGNTSGGTSTATASGSQVVTVSGTYYFRAQSAAGCWGNEGSVTVTINPIPPVIGGSLIICQGATGTLTDATGGGTWLSSNTGVMTVGSGSGAVTGISAGTSTITYTATGCFTTTVATVNVVPPAIGGPLSVCMGTSATLSDGTTGGTWTSGSTGTAVIGSSSGIVTTIASGTSVIIYTAPVTGCTASTTLTVNALPGTIGGTMSVCQGLTTTLNDATPGGTWTSGSTGIATIGSSSGVVTGVGAGTSIITYTVTATTCAITGVVTVNGTPNAITGTLAICPGTSTTLADATGGGTWSSTSGFVTVGSSSGIVTGISSGTAVITYMVSATGCITTTTVTVNTLPGSIGGTQTVCQGLTTTLTDGTTGGTWTSGATGFATVGSSNGVVTGIAAGTANITYTITATGCITTAVVTVNSLPLGITGTLTMCPGTSTTLSDATGGGSWSTGAGITIGSSSGIVTGITAGNYICTYIVSATGCKTTATITINPLPVAIGGTLSVCQGLTTTLTDGTTGGTWLSGSTGFATIGSANGVVNGVAAGTANITFTVTATGCATSSVFTVNPLPAVIGGTAVVCVGAVTTLTDGATGGTWQSSNTGIATVGSTTGVVSGVAQGTATITYMLGTGCMITTVATVNPLPAAGTISGSASICTGTTTTLTDGAPGGTWASSNIAFATIGSATGVVSGVSAGPVTITYSVTNSCGTATASFPMTITNTATVGSITGALGVCIGFTATLSDGVTGGTWTSGATGIATIGSSSGIVSGVTTGTATITYTISGSCGTAGTTAVVTVNPLPLAIAGTLTVCVNASTTLTDPSTGGTWASSNTAVATVGSSTGAITGISAGTSTITYILATGCRITAVATVNPVPVAIGGTLSVCSGLATTLTDGTAGGTWSSTNTTTATIGSSTGVVSGLIAGTTVVSYKLTTTGCAIASIFTVNPLPASIGGTPSVCVGSATTLTDATTGGTWLSNNTAIATVASGTGVATGVTTGATTITYTLPTGCLRVIAFTVTSLPAAITGTFTDCVGSITTLADATGGGSWSSSTTAVATVGSGTGIVNGVTPGTATITYTAGTSCTVVANVTINATPVAIAGPTSVCNGSTITLTDATTGGTWSSSATATATIGSGTGIVTGAAAGTVIMTYKLTTGCQATVIVTVNAIPTAITGFSNVCAGSAITLSNGLAGGTWASNNLPVATIGTTSGIVTGVTAGTAVISYTVAGGCFVVTPVTVNPVPAAISGTLSVCSGSGVTLSDGSSGGTWISGTPAIASIGSASGVATGVSAGTTVVSYILAGTGCSITAVFTVNPLPATILGSTTVCSGSAITLSDASAGGTWSSSTTGIATIGTSSGIVSGVATGTAVMTYTLATGCRITTVITVNTVPSISPVTGASVVCEGAAITLADIATGGVWTTTNAHATAGSASGIITGVTAGTDTIIYTITNICGPVSAPYVININPLPVPGTIIGSSSVCEASTISLADVSAGGVWSCSNANVVIGSGTGVVTGVSGGTVVISYSVTNSCGTLSALDTITVNVQANSGVITGSDVICADSVVALADAVPGGVWTSDATSIASVSATGAVTGVAAGSATISYTVTTPCSAATATHPVTVEVCTPVNIKTVTARQSDLLVYPNPSNGTFTVQLPDAYGNAVITIFDVLGKVITTRTLNDASGQATVFSLGKEAAGSYVVRVNMGGVTYRKEVVVIR